MKATSTRSSICGVEIKVSRIISAYFCKQPHQTQNLTLTLTPISHANPRASEDKKSS